MGFAERDEELADRLAEGGLHHPHGGGLREGRHPVLKLFEVERGAHSDDVGAVARNCPNFT